MKKVFDQTVRDLKREVNKKVLKVPTVEQKILDATSNEPWGPHGSDLGDIAQATRNYHEYQMIMNVIWKRINDTGKNWRHVYKALTVLEYLVANGSERVIDEIREHAHQLSTLSDFQYIDSSGRDQGSNVRRRSLSLVSLVNDKERIHEVRQKALENKDKYRGTSTGGAYKPGGYGDRYDDDRYGNRDDDRNGYGKERDWGSRDDDRYGRSNGRDGGRYGRDPDDHYGRDGYRDDDYRGRGNDDFQYGSRNRRSTDRDTDRSYEDDDRYSTRSSGGRGDAFPQDERRPEHKLSDRVGAPPSYEEAVKDTQNHIQDEKDGASSAASTQNASSPVAPKVSSPTESTGQGPDHVVESVPVTAPTDVVDAFDEFDPRCSAPAALPATTPEMDFFGSLSVSDSANSLALMPVTSGAKPSESDMSNSGYGTDFVALSTASAVMSEPSENPFGDPPFKATPQENFPDQLQSSKPTTSFEPPSMVGGADSFPPPATKIETVPNFDFGDALGGLTYAPSIPNDQHSTANLASQPLGFPEAQATNDILDALLPPVVPSTGTSSLLLPQQAGPTHMQTAQMSLPTQTEMSASLVPQSVQFPSQVPQPMAPSSIQTAPPSLVPQTSLTAAAYDPLAALTTAGPSIKTQPSMEKFEPKSTVWADTLSRGLVNLNISGPKINPLADIGIDFESMNRKEKRKEAKSSAAPVTSTITMGKAMGTGSGIGRAGASGLAPPPNAMVNSGIAMGMGGVGPGMGMGVGMGGGGYGGSYGGGMNQPMNQPMGMGMNMNMGMGMGMNMNMGMGMGMGMGPGASMRPPMGMPPPGPGMPGAGYNPMMGQGPYTSQQPYGGGYR